MLPRPRFCAVCALVVLLAVFCARSVMADAPAYTVFDISQAFGSPPGDDAEFQFGAINNNGQMLVNGLKWHTTFWTRSKTESYRALVYSPGMLREIVPSRLSPNYQVWLAGIAINDQGQMAGRMGDRNLLYKSIFRDTDGVFEIMGRTGNSNDALYIAYIDEGGSIHGWRNNNDGEPYHEYFVLSKPSISVPRGARGETPPPMPLSNKAGYSLDPRSSILRFGNEQWDLNTLFPPGSGWTITEATQITESGYIRATATHNGQVKSVMLQPAGHRDFFDINIRQWQASSGGARSRSGPVCPDGAGRFTYTSGSFDNLDLRQAWMRSADLRSASLRGTNLKNAD